VQRYLSDCLSCFGARRRASGQTFQEWGHSAVLSVVAASISGPSNPLGSRAPLAEEEAARDASVAEPERSRPSAVLSAVRPDDDAPTSVSDVHTVLIAEDDAVSRRLLEQAVRGWGYTTVCVTDGASALAKLSAVNGPRLAILDWEMPGLSGPQVCRILRARTASPYVYLVLLTARTAREHLVTGLASGADDYVLKPFDPMELQLRVRTGQRIVELQHELLAARQELERRANHDALTGAANRGAVLSKVESEASRSARQGSSYCLILFDLDFFKRINDTHGHRAGDIVLKEAVRRAQIELRPYDVLGRYGGEEFMVLLPGCELRAGAVVAERLRKCLADAPFDVDNHKLPVTASFGVVCSSQPHSSLEMLVDAADSALYRAKAGGRNRIELAKPASSRPPGSQRNSLRAVSQRGGAGRRLSFAVPEIEAPSESENGPPSAPLPTMNPIFDRSVLAQVQDLIDDGSNFLEDLFSKYLSNSVTSLEQLKSSLPADQKRRIANTLRGASMSIGASGVADACRRIERGLRAQPDADIMPMLELLEIQLDRVRERYPLEISRMSTRSHSQRA
jgi:two-component system cell cycle response regulator